MSQYFSRLAQRALCQLPSLAPRTPAFTEPMQWALPGESNSLPPELDELGTAPEEPHELASAPPTLTEVPSPTSLSPVARRAAPPTPTRSARGAAELERLVVAAESAFAESASLAAPREQGTADTPASHGTSRELPAMPPTSKGARLVRSVAQGSRETQHLPQTQRELKAQHEPRATPGLLGVIREGDEAAGAAASIEEQARTNEPAEAFLSMERFPSESTAPPRPSAQLPRLVVRQNARDAGAEPSALAAWVEEGAASNLRGGSRRRASSESAASESTVHVHIGRIELRSPTPRRLPPVAAPTPRRSPALDLTGYLKRRSRRGDLEQ
jgi:hypothetical protein